MDEADILAVFDAATTDADPYLTVEEVRTALARDRDIEVTAEAVRHRLDLLVDAERLAKRQFGPGVGYRVHDA